MPRNTRKANSSAEIEVYSQIFNSISNPIFVKDKNHRFVLVNDACCNLFRISREEFLGRSDSKLFPKSEWTIFHKKDNKILNTGIEDVNEETATTSNGTRLRLVTRKTLLETASGERFVLGISTDITEKTQLLKKFRDSERKYKTIFNMGSDPTGLFRYPELTVIEVNNAFLALAGVSRKSVIGKRAKNAFSWIDLSERSAYYDKLLKDKQVDNMEIHLKNQQGVIIPFLVSSRMLKIDHHTAVLYSLKDITTQKNIERYVLEKIMETEERERRRFAADLHDDLGPILSTIKLHLGILEKTAASQKTKKKMGQLDSLLNEVIEKVHNLSHNITSHLIEDFGLDAAVHDLCLKVRAKNNFSITYRSNLGDARFPKEVEIHYYRIASELINNTMKHSGAKMAFLDLDFSNSELLLRYSDNGKGYDVNKILMNPLGTGILNIIQRANLLKCDIDFVRNGKKTEVRILKKML